MTMSARTKTQLIPKNARSQATRIEIEDQTTKQFSNKKPLPSDKPQPDIHALMASEVRYRRLFETAKDGILILDAATGQITDVNPFLEEMLGYSHAELIGKELWEIGPVKDISASQEALRHLQEKEYIRYEDLPLETKGYKRVQVEFVSNVYLVDGFKVIQCNIRDITARRDAEMDARIAHTELLALVAELQRRDREMKLLIQMDDLLQSCTSLAEAYQVIAIMAGDLFNGQNGCLSIFDAQNQHLEAVARWGTDTIIESTFLLKNCWAMRRGQPHIVTDPKKELLCQHFIQPPEAGTLCLPLMVQGETLGLLAFVDNQDKEHLTRQQQFFVTVSEVIKLSLSNIKLREELREQAIRDPLTGLYNRRYLEESLAHELYRSQRQKGQLCVAMIDLDEFKQVNDSLGHGAGDSVLRHVSRILRENLRNSDILCRYGGDEFLLVLTDSSLDDTRQRLDQIRILIKGQAIRYGENLIGPVTVSIGIAAAKEHSFVAREIIHAADEALYAAKQVGNNQIFIYQNKP
jgi:diguanylate cyclase (GGDEF)-like protein/PAS domain S-box-containing protein